METAVIKKKIDLLSDDQVLKVDGYINSLLEQHKISKTNVDDKLTTKATDQIKPGFGGGKGIFGYMADDFDAPLEDFKDYM
ncbi:MAG: hypothetical protein JWR09_3783 [Mucilaginibacter sp.]|nr:hypothetical protein [Mucilaginibacter sp.]